MNKWEDSFKKPSEGLFIPSRQLSAVVAALLLLFFVTFMAGYFLGKKKMVEQFTQEIRQDAVADHIYTTVLTAPQNQSSEVNELLVTQIDDKIIPSSSSINQDINEIELLSDAQQNQRYYAQLIGFGTEKAAQSFVKKLAAKGIETEVKKRVSKTAKGHTSYWYQVVTGAYSDKKELSALVDKLAKEENIKDACIRVC